MIEDKGLFLEQAGLSHHFMEQTSESPRGAGWPPMPLPLPHASPTGPTGSLLPHSPSATGTGGWPSPFLLSPRWLLCGSSEQESYSSSPSFLPFQPVSSTRHTLHLTLFHPVFFP